MRNKFAQTLYELAKTDPKLIVIVADISPAGAMDKFRTDFPERFINTGVAEAAMIGMAAGLAAKGYRPFCYTIATFALYRAFEFVRDDLAYQGLPVTVVGIGGGVAYSTLGGTHHAMEDIAVAAAVPDMMVMAPCDPYETEEATKYCAKQTMGPVYMRLGKAGEPTYTGHEPWQFGKLRHMQVGDKGICILTYGPTGMRLAYEVSEKLKSRLGTIATIFSVPTLNPLDIETVNGILSLFQRVVVIEEMVVDRGLGMWVRASAQQQHYKVRVDTFGLLPTFTKHVYGSHSDVLAAHGLTTDNIVRRLSGSAT